MNQARRLAWHGMTLLLFGLLIGIAVGAVVNPRMGLSAHVGTVLNGVWLMALASIWGWLALSPRALQNTYWLMVGGSYLSSVGLLLAAVFGTSRSTPLAGAGFSGQPWQEALVDVALNLGGAAVLIASMVIVWGLRRHETAGS